ncbi:Hypothetical predicted protein [Paramuricea clavata]|uniref:Uncharacterized protein n=1 Tax=Paramuricea clavata TaxID=317549 RepID=A0A7D9LRG0_PARCT|nr:Hypothetical predicted protein [Paramuricea clavata]
MEVDGFYGGNFVLSRSKDRIMIRSWLKQTVIIETMHISCKSDTYKKRHNYGGVIIYQYDGKSEWRTANNTRCKSGYIAIQDTDSENVKKWIGKEPGQVHGAVYRNVFGESKTESVVGEGFAIQNGEIKFNSSVFNSPENSVFHDGQKWMNEWSKRCVRKIVKEWMTAGSSGVKGRNFDVKQLLSCDSEDNTQYCNIL